jgi:hypothetical protein
MCAHIERGDAIKSNHEPTAKILIFTKGQNEMNTLLTLSIFIGLALLSAMLTLFAVAFYESVQRARRIRPDMRGKSFWQVARELTR